MPSLSRSCVLRENAASRPRHHAISQVFSLFLFLDAIPRTFRVVLLAASGILIGGRGKRFADATNADNWRNLYTTYDNRKS